MGSTIRDGANRLKVESRLDGNCAGGAHYVSVWVLLSQIVVGGPGHGLPRLGRESKQLILKAVSCFRLVGAINHPVVNAERIRDWNVRPQSHVIEGKKIEPERPRIVHLVFTVVPFDAQRTAPFAEIHG